MSTENEGGLFSCPVMCWIIGALLGLATYLILSGRFQMGMIIALVIALVVFALAGLFLGRLFCRASTSTHTHPARHDHDIAASREAIVSADSSGAMVSGIPSDTAKTTSAGLEAVAAAEATKAAEKPAAKAAAKPAAKAATKPAAKAATKPAAKAAAKPVAKAATKPVAKAATKPAAKAATKPAAKAAAKPAAKAAAKPAAKAAAKPARKPIAKDGKPEMLTNARTSGADDLKQIKGVGPKLEAMLNTMGVYHFDQVSGWRAKEVKWVDENLEGFKGRVSRDKWVGQAKVLARGGQTEFSKKVEKGGVYAKNKK